jgi:hypothetical protein
MAMKERTKFALYGVLNRAVRNNKINAVKKMLSIGITPERLDDSSLYIALSNQNLEMFKLLIESYKSFLPSIILREDNFKIVYENLEFLNYMFSKEILSGFSVQYLLEKSINLDDFTRFKICVDYNKRLWEYPESSHQMYKITMRIIQKDDIKWFAYVSDLFDIDFVEVLKYKLNKSDVIAKNLDKITKHISKTLELHNNIMEEYKNKRAAMKSELI